MGGRSSSARIVAINAWHLVVRKDNGNSSEIDTVVDHPERSDVCLWTSALSGSADAAAGMRPRLRIPVFPASRRHLIVGAVATTSGVKLAGFVQPSRQSLAESTRLVDTYLTNLDHPMRLRRSRRSSSAACFVSPRGATSPTREDARGQSIVAVGRKVGMSRSPLARVDRPVLCVTVYGQRYAPRGRGTCTRRRAQNRGRM